MRGLTTIHLFYSLRLQDALHTWAPALVEHATIIHRPLQTVALPSKQIIRMSTITVTHERPHKWL